VSLEKPSEEIQRRSRFPLPSVAELRTLPDGPNFEMACAARTIACQTTVT
jgi:hypothetical protein